MKKNRMLYREFIKYCLYDPKDGYFTNPKNSQLGKLEEIIPFQTFLGYNDFVKYLGENYPKNNFLTPSEIFKPYYGMTLGNLVRSHFDFRNLNENREFPHVIGSFIKTFLD
jgi:hypothetical protein